MTCMFIFVSGFLGVAAASAQTSTLRANGKIAFTSDRDGNNEIYVMDPGGSKQTRITNNDIVDDHPTWSPDGRKIAFISQRPTGGFAIFQMNADGTGKTEITPVNYEPSPYYASGWTITWAPDGRQLAFTDRQGNSSIVAIVNADGSSRRTLTSGYGPSWSPDGSRILLIDGAFPWYLVTIRPDGTDGRVLPALPNYYNWYYDAAWSPTGDQIAITAFDGANEVIFIANADLTNPREFFAQCTASVNGCSRLAAPSWSPDGRTLVFFTWGSHSGRQIHAVDIAGGDARQLTNSVGTNYNPSWQRLAPFVTIGGRVVTPDGRGLRNATISLTDDNGVRLTATTSSFGYYTLENVTPGQAYTIAVSSKRYRFASLVVSVDSALTNVDFAGLE